MNSAIGLPLAIGGATILGMLFFWCTYRHQIEPAGGRQNEDAINAAHAAAIRREIYLERQRNLEEDIESGAKENK